MSSPFRLGDLSLQTVSGGRMRLDGGTMFGVVPRVLWERACEPDEQNRIAMDTNCLLVRGREGLMLIDTGYGSKVSPKARTHNALESGNPILENLARLGVQPEDVRTIILTHLHFDHAGGSTIRDDSGRVKPAFPKARFIVQKAEWEDATAGLEELAGAYDLDDVVPLQEAGQLELVDGDAEVIPGVVLQRTGGHTRGHQIVRLGQPQQAILISELCPTTAHLRTFWTMAYDQDPLEVRRIKPRLLGEATDRGHVVLFNHDPTTRAAALRRRADGGLEIGQEVLV